MLCKSNNRLDLRELIMRDREEAMSLQDTIQFYEKIFDPSFVQEQAELSALIASEEDPDKVANMAAEHMGLHFTGSELLSFAEEIRVHRRPGAGLAATSLAATPPMPQLPRGGLILPGIDPALSLALKAALVVLVKTQVKEGKSDDEIRKAVAEEVEKFIGVSTYHDQIMKGKPTGVEWLDVPINAAASVMAGTAEAFQETTEKVDEFFRRVFDKIFSGW
jgi:hypothetical protein